MKPERQLQLLKWAGMLLPVVVVLVLVGGIVPVKASSGHWPITEYILHFVMRRSVSTHSMPVDAPSFEPELWRLGKVHYRNGCAACHGIPGQPVPVAVSRAVPAPPPLDAISSKYDVEELFYVIKHGIKFTGMPAWPRQQRDDEVWSVVAYLAQLQAPAIDAIPAAAPIENGAPTVPPVVSTKCAACHGQNGSSVGPSAIPHLGGQDREYLYTALLAYARGKRHSAIMETAVQLVPERELRQAADWYAVRPVATPLASTNATSSPDANLAALLVTGRSIATQGLVQHRVPACNGCHEKTQRGERVFADDIELVPAPRLRGQSHRYLLQQLRLFAAGERGGGPYAHLMQYVRLHTLSTEEMEAVTRYFETAPAHELR